MRFQSESSMGNSYGAKKEKKKLSGLWVIQPRQKMSQKAESQKGLEII